MRVITNGPSRRLSFAIEEDSIILQEREPYVEKTGASYRKRWTDDRVSITIAELEKLTAKVGPKLHQRHDSFCSGVGPLEQKVAELERQLAEERAKVKELQPLEDHRRRMIAWMDAWSKYIHPDYGPCDAIADGKCSECVGIFEQERAKTAVAVDALMHYANRDNWVETGPSSPSVYRGTILGPAVADKALDEIREAKEKH